MDDIKLDDYVKHIRASCINNDCNEFMFACMKNLQYFDSKQWKKLDRYLLEELGVTEREQKDSGEMMNKKLKGKQEELRKIKK